MKLQTILTLCVVLCLQSQAEIIQIKLRDGEILTGNLELPKQLKVSKLVFFVQSTGPHTYADHRNIGGSEFNYFDVFARELNKRGFAFFSYSRRGVFRSDNPPYYDSIDRLKYQKYLPQIEADDIAVAIKQLVRIKTLRHASVVLLGWSEGSIVAARVAEERKVKIKAIVLAGYAHDKMSDIIRWQLSGKPSMLNFAMYFDSNNNKEVSRSEYESDAKPATAFRTRVLQNLRFQSLDVHADSVITYKDFRAINKPRLDAILYAFENRDDEWIWENYFRVTSAWLRAHEQLEPNSIRLPKLTLPIFIVHGRLDANCSVEGVVQIRKAFDALGKSNLETFVFDNHDHDLNYRDWITKSQLSEGMQKLFEIIDHKIQ